MIRRDFMLRTVALLGGTGLSIAACTPVTTTSTTPGTRSDPGKRAREINARVDATLMRLYGTARGSRELAEKANGVLVFPSVLAAGFGVGGQFGEGALRVKDTTTGYYRLASLSVGLQIGAQSKAIIFLLMTPDALTQFRNRAHWSVGADASVALIKVGATGALDLTTATGPIYAFVLTNTGLMANLTLEGTRISPLNI